MKHRFPSFRRPERDALLPASLAFLLAVAIGLQIAAASQDPLPASGIALMGPRNLAIPSPVPAGIPPTILERPLFAPRGSVGAGAAVQAERPLSGAVFAGSISRGRQARAIVRQADGRIVYLAPGATLAGWRLASIGQNGVSIVRAGKTIQVPYGAVPLPQPASTEEEEVEQ